MPSPQFDAALAKLTKNRHTVIVSTLDAWKSISPTARPDWGQIARNIENETALGIAIFTSLLRRWADGIDAGATPESSWTTACAEERNSTMLGHALSEAESPDVLGRATSLASYAQYSAGGSFTEATIKDALLDCPDGDLLKDYPAIGDYLKTRLLGGEVIWATFNESRPSDNPFEGFPDDTTGVCTALGLELATEVMILLTYERAAYASEPTTNRPDLHRPTVAEACKHYLFRPWNDPMHHFGYTSPTPSGTPGVTGCPEVVHRKISGKGLRFPYRLSTTTP